jgi:hypothetical protein
MASRPLQIFYRRALTKENSGLYVFLREARRPKDLVSQELRDESREPD